MVKMKGVALAADIRRNLGVMKERVLEKLGAAAVPADALENARHFLESVVRDVTVAAHGLTKDALHRVKTHLVDILPSLSPAITTKVYMSFLLVSLSTPITIQFLYHIKSFIFLLKHLTYSARFLFYFYSTPTIYA